MLWACWGGCLVESVMRAVSLVACVFFQAEDGIRVAQESRGLGDVYKRQTVRTNAQELVLRAAVQPGQMQYFVRAAFLP